MTVFFSKNFYSLKAIKKAIKSYKELAVFEIKEKNNIIEVKIDNIDKDIKDVIKDEFCNYVLAETKKIK